MLQKFITIKSEFEGLEKQLHDTSLVLDHQKLKTINKRYAELQPIVDRIRALEDLERAKTEAEKTLVEGDEDFKLLASDELNKIAPKMDALLAELHTMTRETDPNDKRSAIIEIRAGAGGDEAALFAAELFRVYSRYAEDRDWKKT